MAGHCKTEDNNTYEEMNFNAASGEDRRVVLTPMRRSAPSMETVSRRAWLCALVPILVTLGAVCAMIIVMFVQQAGHQQSISNLQDHIDKLTVTVTSLQQQLSSVGASHNVTNNQNARQISCSGSSDVCQNGSLQPGTPCGSLTRYKFYAAENQAISGYNIDYQDHISPVECALWCAIDSDSCPTVDIMNGPVDKCVINQYGRDVIDLTPTHEYDHLDMISSETGKVLEKSDSLATSVESTFFAAGRVHLKCPVYPPSSAIRLRAIFDPHAGDFTVDINGKGMSCNHDDAGRMYVFPLTTSCSDDAWVGQCQMCRLASTDEPTPHTQSCVYACSCSENCTAVQVVHMPEQGSTTSVKICFMHLQWNDARYIFA